MAGGCEQNSAGHLQLRDSVNIVVGPEQQITTHVKSDTVDTHAEAQSRLVKIV